MPRETANVSAKKAGTCSDWEKGDWEKGDWEKAGTTAQATAATQVAGRAPKRRCGGCRGAAV